MSAGSKFEGQEILSLQEMQEWASQEVRDSAKALELRVREAIDLVSAYATGEISGSEAMEKLHRYDRRWGEALPGVKSGPNMDDVGILASIDQSRLNKTSTSQKYSERALKSKTTENER